MNNPRMSDARESLTRLAKLFDFTVTENVPAPQPRTKFTLTRDNKVVCEIRVGWTDDDHVAEIHVWDGGGSGRRGGAGCDLDRLLSDELAMAEGMVTYFRNNRDFDGGA